MPLRTLDRALEPSARSNIPFRGRQVSSPGKADEMSDSDVSTASPVASRCFCGKQVEGADGGIYCSVCEFIRRHRGVQSLKQLGIACARSDAFSSLCYKPATTSVPPSSFNFPQNALSMRTMPSLGSSTSVALSRHPSDASTTSTTESASPSPSEDWNASHYRRLARADIRREERREERKKRRADHSNRGTALSTSSCVSRGVPELVGGHSRNPSTASTASSAITIGSLSRNPSSASSASTRRFGGVHVDTMIAEDDDEKEWLAQGSDQSTKPNAPPPRKHHRRHGSKGSNGMSMERVRQLESFGMGKDMRDVLEEIIQMEKGFMCSDSEDQHHLHHHQNDPTQSTLGLFTSRFDRPPRTPSPMAVDKRDSVVPAAPARGHRASLSIPNASPGVGASFNNRPTSIVGMHQSSLSESHTALYLATASPAGPGRRSVSPKLQARKSLTFTPDKAGPSIDKLRPSFRFDTPAGSTPIRRRGNLSPSAHHPTMDHWRFPAANANNGSNSATPTRLAPINTTNLPGGFATPVHQGEHQLRETEREGIPPQLLWPPSSLPHPLAPALFPTSPAVNTTPDFHHTQNTLGHLTPSSSRPSHTGLRLGVLFGSGEVDVDMDDDEEDSLVNGHDSTTYLPVFLEAEEFNGRQRRWR